MVDFFTGLRAIGEVGVGLRVGEGEWLADPESEWGTLTVAPVQTEPGKLTRTKVKTELGDYRLYYANVRDAINGAAKLEITPEDGWRVIRLLEMVRYKWRRRKTLVRFVVLLLDRFWSGGPRGRPRGPIVGKPRGEVERKPGRSYIAGSHEIEVEISEESRTFPGLLAPN